MTTMKMNEMEIHADTYGPDIEDDDEDDEVIELGDESEIQLEEDISDECAEDRGRDYGGEEK